MSSHYRGSSDSEDADPGDLSEDSDRNPAVEVTGAEIADEDPIAEPPTSVGHPGASQSGRPFAQLAHKVSSWWRRVSGVAKPLKRNASEAELYPQSCNNAERSDSDPPSTATDLETARKKRRIGFPGDKVQ